MKKINFVVEKTGTGFSAYYEDNDNILAATTGSNIPELKNNILESYNLFAEHQQRQPITAAQVGLQFDLSSFFEFYKEINAAALGRRIGINKSLISEYVNGKRTPSEKQVQRILTGIKQLGRELTELEIV
ncbi:MAG: helix-turn-helix transcriptional regulator [Mucilaginibacter sp.]